MEDYKHLFTFLMALTFIASTLSQNRVNYNVLEKLQLGTFIGNVKVDGRLSEQYTSAELELLRFSILKGAGGRTDGSQYFSILETTGALQLAKEINRDTLCLMKDTCQLKFDVAVSPAQYFQVISVNIQVMDTNDHTPSFPQDKVFLTILESSPPGSTFTLPAAQDGDGKDFGITSYTMSPAYDNFEISAQPNTYQALNLELVIVKPLDREETLQYVFTITATDGGNPPKSSTMAVNITVTDVNDNTPVFEEEEYRADIPEDSIIGSMVTRVKATDVDMGPNARITYGFTPVTYSTYGNIFEINEETGEIFLLAKLDREMEVEYELTVTALDGGSNGRLATVVVIVTVSDINDNKPTMSLTTLTDDGQARISEAADVGTFVALLLVNDPDLAQNGNVVCTLNSREFSLQLLKEDKYKIVTKERLDREIQSKYDITVGCHDNGVPMLEADEEVTIRVIDVNDNAPLFVSPAYRVEIMENNPSRTFVVQVNATDPDLGPSSDITYRILNDFHNLFTINPLSGIITTRASLNHEMSSSLELLVEAKDKGEPALSSTATVYIDIIDVNDEIPMFHQLTPTFIFRENQPPKSEVGFLNAMDPDSPPFNQITYSLISIDGSDLPFEVDENSGHLTSKTTMDREAQTVYYFKASAANTGYPGMSSTVTVTVYIADENDNQPQIDFPNKINDTVMLSNKLSPGDHVTSIRAHDMDTGDNAKLEFSVLAQNGSEQNLVNCDRATGALYLNLDLSGVVFEIYKLTAIVKDKGVPPYTTSVNFTVNIDAALPPPGAGRPEHGGQHLDGEDPDSSDGANNNLIVVICVVAISGVFIIILLAAIIFVVCKSRKENMKERPMKIEPFHGKPQIYYDTRSRDEEMGGTLKNNGAFQMENTSHLSEGDWTQRGDRPVYPTAPRDPYNAAPEMHCGPDVIPSDKTRSRKQEKDGEDSDENSSSGDLSTSDSGRGGSEEGDHSSHSIHGHREPHAPPRYTTSHIHVPPQRLPSFPHPGTSKDYPAYPDPNINSLPLPPRQRPVPPRRDNPPSPTPSDTPSASIRPGVRSIKLRDKYQRQQEENTNTYRGSFSLLNDVLHRLDTDQDAGSSAQ